MTGRGSENMKCLSKLRLRKIISLISPRFNRKLLRNKRNYDQRYQHDQINEICYMEKMKKIQEWEDKAQREIQTKKKYYLNICGYFKECMKMKDSSTNLGKVDFPDSENISNSGLLERHERSGSQHLSYTGRNHVLEGYKYSSGRKEKNKSVSNLSESHGDRLSHRIKTIDIVSSHNQSFSSKGPIIPPSELRTPLNIDGDGQIGRKSENLVNYQLRSIEDEVKFQDEKGFKESLEKRIIESQDI